MKMAILHRGSPALDDHTFRRLITYSSPLRTMLALIFVASEEATSGSVIAKHDRISPASRGFNHFSFCPGVPYRASTSIFPVSGAEQLKTSAAIMLRPMISHSGAYSRFVNPAPFSLSATHKFHSPAHPPLRFTSFLLRIA